MSVEPFTNKEAQEAHSKILALMKETHRVCLMTHRLEPCAAPTPHHDDQTQMEDSPGVLNLYQLGIEAASFAAISANHALVNLIRFLAQPDTVGPATRSIYPVARSAIEGAVIAHKILDVSCSFNQRLLRSGTILVWSTRELLTYANELGSDGDKEINDAIASEWAALYETLHSAGIEMVGGNNKRPWEKLRRASEDEGKFEITREMRKFGTDVGLMYRMLSAGAHHTPWINGRVATYTPATDGGTFLGTDMKQSDQLGIIANVCHMLLMSNSHRATYYGYRTDEIRELGEEVDSYLRELALRLAALGA